MKLILILLLLLSACSVPEQDFTRNCFYNNLEPTAKVHHFLYELNLYAKVDCVQAPDVIDLNVSRVIYSFELPGLEVGEVIEPYIQFEVTNDMPKPMMVSWYWVLSDNPNSHNGTEITRRVGENITPGTHHAVFQAAGYHKVQDPGLNYLNLVVYAASGEKDLTGEHVIIERGYSTILIRRTNERFKSKARVGFKASSDRSRLLCSSSFYDAKPRR